LDFIVLTKSTTPIIGWVAELLGLIMDLIFRATSTIGIMNIGLCIILFTIIINLILLPLTIKQQRSSKIMAVMQPEIQAIQKKYKGKDDRESMTKQQAEISAVYQKYGTSATGGCVQLLLQMPILFGLYQVIYRIPAYVPGVKSIFQNITDVLMAQPNYINSISELATTYRLPIDKVDYTMADKVIDLLYKFTPANWDTLKNTVPAMSDVLSKNVPIIESMNYFFGINLSTNPWQGLTPNPAWIIPILAGVTQWYSTKIMSDAQQTTTSGDENSMAQQMKAMNTTMPLMSLVFCFTLPSGIGIYWIASAVCRIIQQFFINKHLEKIDIDVLIQENLDKANLKREKKGLPPQTINKYALENAKHEKDKQALEEANLEKKRERTAKHIEDSTAYYNKNAKPGSIAAKANMVAMYDEKMRSKKNKVKEDSK
jgi:membrane protein insertase, yidC/oxa1 family